MENKNQYGTNRKVAFNEKGHIVVPNLSAYWIPEITLSHKIHGTTYIVSGSFSGIEPITHQLERIVAQNIHNESSISAEKAEDTHDSTAGK